MVNTKALMRLQLFRNCNEFTVYGFERVIPLSWRTIRLSNHSSMAGTRINVIRNSLCSVRQRCINQVTHLIRSRYAHRGGPGASLNDIQERDYRLVGGAPNQ